MFSILTAGTSLKDKSTHTGDKELKRKRATVEVDEVLDSEACAKFRRLHKIKVTGESIEVPILPLTTFKGHLRPFLEANLEGHGYDAPTPIQTQAIPLILDGRDVLACAPTGSGKTLAFALPILQLLKTHKSVGYRAVIVSPTRELAGQIYSQFKMMSSGSNIKVCLLTKSNAAIQTNASELHDESNQSLANAYDILITTPLRLVNLIKEETVNLSRVKYLIVDEADRLFEEGFVEQTDEILAACTHKKLRKALFSATLPSGLEQLAKTVMKHPVRVVVGQKDTATDDIEQNLVYVGTEQGKLLGIRQLAKRGDLKPPVLVFVQSIERAKELHQELSYDVMNVDVIHSDRPQSQRDEVIRKFNTGEIWLLIATELLARGIDFKGISLVINYDFPQSVQSYIHRIGRTGRAGNQGRAITFFSKADGGHLKSIASVIKSSGGNVPEWMLQLKKPSKNEKKALKKAPVKRKHISTRSAYDVKKEAHKKEMIKNSKKQKINKAVAEKDASEDL